MKTCNCIDCWEVFGLKIKVKSELYGTAKISNTIFSKSYFKTFTFRIDSILKSQVLIIRSFLSFNLSWSVKFIHIFCFPKFSPSSLFKPIVEGNCKNKRIAHLLHKNIFFILCKIYSDLLRTIQSKWSGEIEVKKETKDSEFKRKGFMFHWLMIF